MATLFNTKIKDTYQSLLKLEDNTILTTTVKNVTDGLGNASPLYMSTTRIGIGTNNPAFLLDIKGTARLGDTGAQGKLLISRASDGATVGQMYGTASGLVITPYAASGSSMLFANGGQISIGSNEFDGPAKFNIKGSGSTSATTSLLVQNSGGTNTLRVYDDQIVEVPYRIHTPFIRNSSGNLVLFAGNFEVEIQSTNPNLGNGSLRTTGDITTTDNQTKNVINVNNLVSSTSASFNTLNGFAFTSTITQTTGTIRGLFINPTLNASTNFRAIETVTGNVLLGTTSGFVGIGTSSPATEVHIKQVDSNASLLRLESASSVASNTYQVGVDFYSRITGAGGTDSFPVGKMYATGGGEFRSGKLRFQTIITNGGSLTDTMTLHQGNVSIGSLNTTPSKLLEITGLKDTIVADFSSNTVGVNEGISIQLSAAAGAYPLGVIKGIFTANSGYSALTFSTSTLNTPTEAMRITSGQNVLIGTTTDAGYKLDVNGSARFSSTTIVQSTQFADSGQIFRNGGNLALQSVAGVGNNNSVCINTSPNDTDAAIAILVIKSTTKGVLFPRMTTAQKLAIVSPVGGLQVFDTTLNQMSYYNGTTWVNF